MSKANIDARIREAAELIRAGGVAAFPTETVYGLGANALDAKAVAKIFEIKKRPLFDPLIVHVWGAGWIDELAADIPSCVKNLIYRFWPGPLTLVLPKMAIVPDIVTAGLPGVALRVPANDIARKLIDLAGVPIAAPSANLFGAVSPTTAEHVREQLGGAVDMILDGGPCTVGVESTIISFMTDAPVMLRPGGVPLEEIEEALGEEVIVPGQNEMSHQAPGRCETHYATSAPMVLIDDVHDIVGICEGGGGDAGNIDDTGDGGNARDIPGKKVGLLTFVPVYAKFLPPNVSEIEFLSENGDLREAACNLFAAMRRLDAAGVDVIAAMPMPTSDGLGRAINDRLYRASRKRA